MLPKKPLRSFCLCNPDGTIHKLHSYYRTSGHVSNGARLFCCSAHASRWCSDPTASAPIRRADKAIKRRARSTFRVRKQTAKTNLTQLTTTVIAPYDIHPATPKNLAYLPLSNLRKPSIEYKKSTISPTKRKKNPIRTARTLQTPRTQQQPTHPRNGTPQNRTPVPKRSHLPHQPDPHRRAPETRSPPAPSPLYR